MTIRPVNKGSSSSGSTIIVSSGKYKGVIDSSVGMGQFSDAVTGDYWLWVEESTNFGGLLLNKGDKILCVSSFSGVPVDLTDDTYFETEPSTVSTASSSNTGVVKIGAGLTVTADGTIQPKVGVGVKLDSDGFLVADEEKINVLNLKNIGQLDKGNPRGPMASSVSSYADAKKGDWWHADSTITLLGKTFSTGDELYCLADITGTPTSFDATSWYQKVETDSVMEGATSSTNGASGLVPAPGAGMQDAHLQGDGTWKLVLNRTLVTLQNFTTNTTLDALTSVDVAEVIAVPQTTSNITLTVPSPTVVDKVRKLLFINTGTVGFYLSTGHFIPPGKWLDLYWSLALAAWKGSVVDVKPYVASSSYQAYDRVQMGDIQAYCNADIPSNTTFAWGTSGQTWSPVLGGSLTFRGLWAASTTYNSYDVFCNSSAYISDFFMVPSGSTYTSGSSSLATDMLVGGAFQAGNVKRMNWGISPLDSSAKNFVGSNATTNGVSGTVPSPSLGKQYSKLMADGTWDGLDSRNVVTLSNFTGVTTLTAATTVDVASIICIPQTTEPMAINLPPPTVTTSCRTLKIINTGTAKLMVSGGNGGGKYVLPNHFSDYVWDSTLMCWTTSTDDVGVHNSSIAYRAGDRVMLGGIVAIANASISSGTSFVWGTSGATWSPQIPYGYTWRGVYTTSTTYAVNDVFVVNTSVYPSIFFRVVTAFTSSTSGYSTDIMSAGSSYATYVTCLNLGFFGFDHANTSFVGATATGSGRGGLVPTPVVGNTKRYLCVDGTWGNVCDYMKARLASSMATTSGTAVVVQITNGTSTVGNSYTFDSANYKITVTRTGWHRITIMGQWLTSSTSTCRSIQANSTGVWNNGLYLTDTRQSVLSLRTTQSASDLVYLASGANIFFMARQDSGETINFDTTQTLPFLSVEFMGS